MVGQLTKLNPAHTAPAKAGRHRVQCSKLHAVRMRGTMVPMGKGRQPSPPTSLCVLTSRTVSWFTSITVRRISLRARIPPRWSWCGRVQYPMFKNLTRAIACSLAGIALYAARPLKTASVAVGMALLSRELPVAVLARVDWCPGCCRGEAQTPLNRPERAPSGYG